MGNELSNNEAGRGFTHIYTATYEDLQTIGNGGQATIATIPAGGAVEMVGVYESEAFAGTTSLVIDVGTSSGDPDEFIDALDVDAMSAPSSTQVMPSQVINHNLRAERTAQHPYFLKLRMPQSHQLPPERSSLVYAS